MLPEISNSSSKVREVVPLKTVSRKVELDVSRNTDYDDQEEHFSLTPSNLDISKINSRRTASFNNDELSPERSKNGRFVDEVFDSSSTEREE